MAFPVSDEEAPAVALTSVEGPAVVSADSEDKPPTSSPGRPALKRIK
jgi:hypothetical protein